MTVTPQSAFLLLGMALIYAQTGTMQLTALPTGEATSLAGLVLLLVGIGFKLALVPFHLWAPDVYEGAPAPVAAFIASISKASACRVRKRISRGTPHFLRRCLSLAQPWFRYSRTSTKACSLRET